jgi:hypothetical protein
MTLLFRRRGRGRYFKKQLFRGCFFTYPRPAPDAGKIWRQERFLKKRFPHRLSAMGKKSPPIRAEKQKERRTVG